MMLHIPEVLTRDEVAEMRRQLAEADWIDGAATAGAQAKLRKRNLQLSSDSAIGQQLSARVAAALQRHPLFMSAVLPARILPPRFNRYEGGGTYGNHVDSALHLDPYRQDRVRTDVSTTLFLSGPEEYEGGELIVDDNYGAHEVKLPAGDAIVYPATSLHRVEPVTSGTRFASFLWTQSMVRDDWQRSMLFELDMTILKLRQRLGEDGEEVLTLTGHYNNLLRQWAEL
ncbi:MAG TPA: Fe2+-dependent dioxygenase [Rhodocyclaceae bacterium]|nr:Fe2+-dependent dioxygenase [Rhodocyclaceae bacterium]